MQVLARQLSCSSVRRLVAPRALLPRAVVAQAPRAFGASADDATLDGLEDRLKAAYGTIEELIEKRVAIKKDTQQAAKRHHTDLENETKYGCSKLAMTYLQIPDNLQRAADAVKADDMAEDKELKKMHTGVLQMQKVVSQALKSLGISKMEVEGATFDPQMHEAMFAMEMPGKDPNTIFHIMEPGYMIHDRCLRAAKVGVVRG
mmetsp:Transcript_17296/g.45618  ORF Transcript_17296/g.45618 Transcript_17296/m.45618 type:complete len:203 (-) Transcript_17296:161-769(-)